MKRKVLFSALFMPIAAFAMKQEAMFIPEFDGGLDVKKVVQCEKQYKDECSRVKGNSVAARLTHKWACSASKMAKDSSCLQASRIRQLSSAPPTAIRKYGTVSVFDVTSLADGIETYYMVDRKGHFIALNTYLNLSQNATYDALKRKYPGLVLTGFLYWKTEGQSVFPKAYNMPNQTKRLVFRQELRDGYFVAGKKVGVADIAYDFDGSGNYIGASVVNVEALS